MNADEKLIEGLSVECDALKASNAELREQLAAFQDFKDTVQLHGQLVRECAEKAAQRIEGWSIYPKEIEHQALVGVICEAFGAPVKDECEEALQTEWRRMELAGETNFISFRNVFHAAWKLAKGKP